MFMLHMYVYLYLCIYVYMYIFAYLYRDGLNIQEYGYARMEFKAYMDWFCFMVM